jgi:hypothetical protein
LHLRYRFSEEPTVQGLIEGGAVGRFDVAVAALTVTGARERIVISQSRSMSPVLALQFRPGVRQAGYRLSAR